MTYTAKIPTQDIHTDNGHVILRAQQFVELNEIISDTRSKKSQIRFNFNGLTLDRQQICEAYDTIYELMNANNDTNNVALKNSSVPTDESETTNITIINLDGKSLFYGNSKQKQCIIILNYYYKMLVLKITLLYETMNIKINVSFALSSDITSN